MSAERSIYTHDMHAIAWFHADQSRHDRIPSDASEKE